MIGLSVCPFVRLSVCPFVRLSVASAYAMCLCLVLVLCACAMCLVLHLIRVQNHVNSILLIFLTAESDSLIIKQGGLYLPLSKITRTMEKKSGMMLTFLAGAAVGAAIGYLLASGKGEELKEELDETIGKLKGEIDKQAQKGKEFIDEMKKKAEDALHGTDQEKA